MSQTTLRLSTSWLLSTEHASVCYGQPVLVNRASGEGYGSDGCTSPGNRGADRGSRTRASIQHVDIFRQP